MNFADLPLVDTGRRRWGRKIYRFQYDWQRVLDFGDGIPPIVVLIPRGFETDLASIPWPLCLWWTPEGKWAEAAAIHDWLLSRGMDSWFCDAIFRSVLSLDGVYTHRKVCLFYGVRCGSALFRWKRKRRRKELGL